MNKQKISSLAYEIKEMAEELLEKQKDRELVMPHMKDGKTDDIIRNSFRLLNRKYNALLQLALANGNLEAGDEVFFSELNEDSFGDVLIDAALLGRYLKEEKVYKVVNHFSSDEDCQIETEITELEQDEDQLAAEEGKMADLEQQFKKQNIEVKLKIRDHE